ncbi:tRNA(adenine34) deaminase [Binucleata daphniae]
MDVDFFMKAALEEAKKALVSKEFPIGCVIVRNNEIIAKDHNQTNILSNPLAHAEILCLKKLQDYKSITVYVNVEPCIMCMDILRKIGCEVYYGVNNHIFGGSSILNIQYGVKIECTESITLMKQFYKMENANAPENVRKIKKN